MVNVAVDAMGGDNAPVEIVKGAVDAVNESKSVKVFLVGREDVIKAELVKYTYDENQIEVVHAEDVIETGEPPVMAIRKKKDSSIVKAMYMVKDGICDAFVSAGSTGAVLVGGQVIDLEAAEKEVDGKTIHLIHKLKTCALIKASVLMGCAAAGTNEEYSKLSEEYAENFGFAFQIIDDILDFDGNYETCELNSYVKIYGLEKARDDAKEYISFAKESLDKLDDFGFDTENFRELLNFLTERMK